MSGCYRFSVRMPPELPSGYSGIRNFKRKGYHCVWQIHYHIVFPVKYRKALLDKMVIKIIEETAYGIQERYAIEMEALGMDKNHIHFLSSAYSKISPGEIVRIFKSITAREIFRRHPKIKIRAMGWRILVWWILCCNCWWERKLVKSGKLYTKTR